ncbi:MAG: sigma factor-like helix-turn-helix DNA-binding protein [Pyrobaculum sp.]
MAIVEEIMKMHKQGMTMPEIAVVLGVSVRTVKKYLRQAGIRLPQGRRPTLPVVTCPRCGHEGRLRIMNYYGSKLIYVVHTDPETKRRRFCYIGAPYKLFLYPQLTEAYEKLIRH